MWTLVEQCKLMPAVLHVRVNMFLAEHGFPSNTTTGEPCSWETQPCFFPSPKRGGGVWAGVSGPSGDGEPPETRDKTCAARAGCCPHQEHHGHRWIPRSHGRWEQLAPTAAPWWRTQGANLCGTIGRGQPSDSSHGGQECAYDSWGQQSHHRWSQWTRGLCSSFHCLAAGRRQQNKCSCSQCEHSQGKAVGCQGELAKHWCLITIFYVWALTTDFEALRGASGGLLSSQGIQSESSIYKEEITNIEAFYSGLHV